VEHEITLEWVVVEGAPRHVSDFAEIPPKQRPRALCPQCARRLTLKLGTVRRHHAAHAAGQICASTQPETALHLNTKLALAATLAAAQGSGATLSVTRRCAGSIGSAPACERTRVTEWLHSWTEVLVEHRVGNELRPDILLTRDGAAIGAIEVLVSHAVSFEKARVLAELGVQWIEVRADERLATPGSWTPQGPLAVAHASDEREWRCDAHRALHAEMLAALNATRLAEREAARQSAVLVAARVVDLYHAGGARERFIYRVRELATDGRARALQLQRGGLELASTELSEIVDHRDAWPRLRSAFDSDLGRLMRDERSFMDSPMRWARGDPAENIVDEALADRVAHDPTPLATRFPRRWFYNANTDEWFLPSDMRDVRWDRAPDDVFAAHPAWTRARSAVRERAAPEGSWTTPVFANRPAASMFRNQVRAVRRGAAHDPVVVVDLTAPETPTRRAIVVVERRANDAAIKAVASALDDEGVASIWISHPSDWTPALAEVAWAPAGRDSRGRGCIVIDDVGIFRADQFARAIAMADARVDPAAVRRCMAARVERLLGR
jgi:hypothetical protein